MDVKKIMAFSVASMLLMGSINAADWSISPGVKEIGRSGGSFSISTANNDSMSSLELTVGGSDDWITIKPSTRNDGYWYPGDGITVSVAENNALKIYGRTGSVVVNGFLRGQTHNYQNHKGTHYCYIHQLGRGVSFSKDTIRFSGKGGESKNVDISLDGDIPWVLGQSTSSDWLKVSKLRGTGSATITMSAEENTTGQERTAGVYVYDADGATSDFGTYTYTIFVTQGVPPKRSEILYHDLKGATHNNPNEYYEGDVIVFEAPAEVVGYDFKNWEPSGVSEDTKGTVNAYAKWEAIQYKVQWIANNGTTETSINDCVYDNEFSVPENPFTWQGYVFSGWSRTEYGPVELQAGEIVSNLTSVASSTVMMYAVWEKLVVPSPVVSPADGTTFSKDKCLVSISSALSGAEIFYTTNGKTPRIADANRYMGPFEIDDTKTIVAVAFMDGVCSEYVEATITKVEPIPLTLAGAIDEDKVYSLITGGDSEWLPVEDETAKVGSSVVRSGPIGNEQSTYLEAMIYGAGKLSFWWKSSCEKDNRGTYTFDKVRVFVDGENVAGLDGVTDWELVSIEITKDGEHVIRWEYSTDDWFEPGYENCAWVDGLVWTGDGRPVEPSIEGDPNAEVMGDKDNGFVLRPSIATTEITVIVPNNVDPQKVTVEVPTTALSIKANGTNVRVVKVDEAKRYDITKYLSIPTDEDGIVYLSKVEVDQKYANNALDFSMGAKFDPDGEFPIVTTKTEPGLTYVLVEGEELQNMHDGDVKVGDGQPWKPKVSVKVGAQGFYRIKVSK